MQTDERGDRRAVTGLAGAYANNLPSWQVHDLD